MDTATTVALLGMVSTISASLIAGIVAIVVNRAEKKRKEEEEESGENVEALQQRLALAKEQAEYFRIRAEQAESYQQENRELAMELERAKELLQGQIRDGLTSEDKAG